MNFPKTMQAAVFGINWESYTDELDLGDTEEEFDTDIDLRNGMDKTWDALQEFPWVLTIEDPMGARKLFIVIVDIDEMAKAKLDLFRAEKIILDTCKLNGVEVALS